MAYGTRSRAKARTGRSRTAGRRGYGAGRTTRRAPARGRARSAGSGSRTVRIVIEQQAASIVQRPDPTLGLMPERAPRRPAFK